MTAATISWGALLFDSVILILLLLGLGLGLMGIWTLVSRDCR